MTTELTLQSERPLEFAFGTVKPEKAAWMANEYFPTAGPVIAEYGYTRLVGFQVIASNVKDIQPVTGAFGSWPSATARAKLHQDPRLLALLPERDQALDMSDGHLFHALDEVIVLNTDHDYLIIVTADDDAIEAPIFALPLSQESPEMDYKERRISLRPWRNDDEALLAANPADKHVLRVRFQSPE